MAFTADTGDHKVTRSDIFLVDPRALIVDWRKNLSRNGEEPPVDQALMDLARDMMPKKGQGDGEDGSCGQLNPILVRPLSDRRLEVDRRVPPHEGCPLAHRVGHVPRLQDQVRRQPPLRRRGGTGQPLREHPAGRPQAHPACPRGTGTDRGLRAHDEAGGGAVEAVRGVAVEPAQPRDAAHPNPGRRGEREDCRSRQPSN